MDKYKEYSILLEEYLFWVSINRTHNTVTLQLYKEKEDTLYKLNLIKNAVLILRDEFPSDYINYKSNLKTF